MPSRKTLESMPWKDIQALAKANGVKANQKRDAVVDALAALKGRLKKPKPAAAAQPKRPAATAAAAAAEEAAARKAAAAEDALKKKVMRRMGMLPPSPVKGTVRAAAQSRRKARAEKAGVEPAPEVVVDGAGASGSGAEDAPVSAVPGVETKDAAPADVDEPVLNAFGHRGNIPSAEKGKAVKPAPKGKKVVSKKAAPKDKKAAPKEKKATPKRKPAAKGKGKQPKAPHAADAVLAPAPQEPKAVADAVALDGASDLAEEEEVEYLTSFAVESEDEDEEESSGPGVKRKATDNLLESLGNSPAKRRRL